MNASSVFDQMRDLRVKVDKNAPVYPVVSCNPAPAFMLESAAPQLCFANAGVQVLGAEGRYHYVLGSAASSGIPIPFDHAWIYDTEKDCYYDPTWESALDDHKGAYEVHLVLSREQLADYLESSGGLPPASLWEYEAKLRLEGVE